MFSITERHNYTSYAYQKGKRKLSGCYQQGHFGDRWSEHGHSEHGHSQHGATANISHLIGKETSKLQVMHKNIQRTVPERFRTVSNLIAYLPPNILNTSKVKELSLSFFIFKAVFVNSSHTYESEG